MPIPMQEKEMEKQKMLYQQARLHDRGAAEMVLQMVSASKGGEGLTLPPYVTTFPHLVLTGWSCHSQAVSVPW